MVVCKLSKPWNAGWSKLQWFRWDLDIPRTCTFSNPTKVGIFSSRNYTSSENC